MGPSAYQLALGVGVAAGCFRGLSQRTNLVIDVSETRLLDHSVMEKLHELQKDFEQKGLSLELTGVESHSKLSEHPLSARRRG